MDKYPSTLYEAKLASLLSEYMPVIGRCAARYGVSSLGLAREDLELEGMMGLLRAAQTWLPDKGASFSTYASRCISNAISSAAAAAAREKHLPLNSGVPLDESSPLAKGDTPEAHADARELRSALLGVIAAELSTLEREALTLHLAGCGAARAAELLGKPNKSIENALARARRKIALKTAEFNGGEI